MGHHNLQFCVHTATNVLKLLSWGIKPSIKLQLKAHRKYKSSESLVLLLAILQCLYVKSYGEVMPPNQFAINS